MLIIKKGSRFKHTEIPFRFIEVYLLNTSLVLTVLLLTVTMQTTTTDKSLKSNLQQSKVPSVHSTEGDE